MVEAVTLARAEELRIRGVLSSSATVLATTTGSTTLTPVPAPASRLVTQGGIVATLFCRYYKSKTHDIE
jgi:hypothetical protein